MLKKLLPWLALVVVVFLIARAPVAMAHLFTGVWNGAIGLLDSFGTFVSNL